MISSKNMANAVGGKTARACDSCIKKRARWYCAADDAFLCQVCDSSVHSANSLARRHERVRLKTASSSSSLKLSDAISSQSASPSWHKGFTRKARTPRHGKNGNGHHHHHQGNESKEANNNKRKSHQSLVVPEVGADETTSHEENDQEEQLLYRVPIFDPFEAAVSINNTGVNDPETTATTTDLVSESKQAFLCDGLHGFLPSDIDLAEFAADVESLLGKGLENECFGMEELGLIDCRENDTRESSLESKKAVKLEEEEEEEEEDQYHVDQPFELSFDYGSPATCEEEDEDNKMVKEEAVDAEISSEVDGEKKKKINKRNILLRLNYEAVINAWSSQGSSPWTDGHRPDFDPDECWPDCMGTCRPEFQLPYGDLTVMGSHAAMADGGREARVLRYREKRRTRLFSKKIRYEVRKLNAEKRPRMKGRFVKRASFTGPGFPMLNK